MSCESLKDIDRMRSQKASTCDVVILKASLHIGTDTKIEDKEYLNFIRIREFCTRLNIVYN
jgi:hypothetical protein